MMTDGKDIGAWLGRQLDDVEKELRGRIIRSSEENQSFVAFPLISKSGRNMLICALEAHDNSFVINYDWFILHDTYKNIRQKEVETDSPNDCLSNIVFEIQTSRWMVHVKWTHPPSSLVPYLRRVLEVLDNVLVVFDGLIKRYNIDIGKHASCYLGCMSYLRSKIHYGLYLGTWANLIYLGTELRASFKNSLNGDIWITRSKKELSLGMSFKIIGSEWWYELFVKGQSDALIKYVDAMVVEDYL